MVTVNEYGFRQFQTLHDLKQVALLGQGDHLFHIAGLVPGALHSPRQIKATLEQAIAGEGRLPTPVGADAQPCLQLAASLPDQPVPFQTATAILLRDQLSGGAGVLGDHWDAFAPAYRQLAVPVRAALMQGFALLADRGLMVLDPAPTAGDLITDPLEQVRAGLVGITGPLEQVAQVCLGALTGTGPGVVWSRLAQVLLRVETPEARAILRAMRHLFESEARGDPRVSLGDVHRFHLPIPWETA